MTTFCPTCEQALHWQPRYVFITAFLVLNRIKLCLLKFIAKFYGIETEEDHSIEFI